MSYKGRVTDYGFEWGPATVTRIGEIRGSLIIDVTTKNGNSITIYVSPQGRSLRVFGDGQEMRV